MTKKDLDDILVEHTKWLTNCETGKKADLSGAYLSRADLSEADLSGAYLSGADLSGANLSGAYLSGAYLSRADLSEANLSGANLSGADLSGADLSGAYLSGADLSGANLSGANLVYFTFNRHTAYFVFDGYIRIGCYYKTLENWKLEFQELGKKEGYTDTEIAVYGSFIKTCTKLQKEHRP